MPEFVITITVPGFQLMYLCTCTLKYIGIGALRHLSGVYSHGHCSGQTEFVSGHASVLAEKLALLPCFPRHRGGISPLVPLFSPCPSHRPQTSAYLSNELCYSHLSPLLWPPPPLTWQLLFIPHNLLQGYLCWELPLAAPSVFLHSQAVECGRLSSKHCLQVSIPVACKQLRYFCMPDTLSTELAIFL